MSVFCSYQRQGFEFDVKRLTRRGIAVAGVLLALVLTCQPMAAADEGTIQGTVLDQLGGAVPDARVALLRDGQRVTSTTSNPRGEFTFDGLAEGRYQIDVTAPGFAQRTTDPLFVGSVGRVKADIHLQIGTLEAKVLVTAAVTDVLESQIGAPVTVLDSETLQALGNADLLEPIRGVPGVAVVQSGARGAPTSLFVRGGASNFNKVIIDGVPANDIGGAFDLADLAVTGVDRVEVLRGSNSLLYGSDAMTSVVNITTRRGRSRVPEGTFALDGGNLGTLRQELSLGGVARRLDYFAAYSHFQTDNNIANNEYRNDTLASRVGVALGSNTNLSGTVRWIDTDYGSPNTFDFYGIADDSTQKRKTVYASATAQTQINDRWQTTVRFGLADQDAHYVNPTPTGTPSDPSEFANFLGNPVTITGANGYSVTGQAILDYGGSYPSRFDTELRRSLLHGQTGYHVSQALDISGGVRLENERGASISSFGTSESERTNYGGFVEARATMLGHLFVTGGVGLDHNDVFGTAATPRVSVAAYLRPPSSTDALGDTKVTFNAGKGIKEPSVDQELSSLFVLVPPAIASGLGLEPIAPERSRTLDVGIEQGLAHGRGRVRVAYFDNEFRDLIEFVDTSVLPQIGVPSDSLGAGSFGAYFNSQSNRARGVEMSGEAIVGSLKFMASYTYSDAVVTESFGAALFPAENPQFPGIPIGQYSPLVGARPFRRPTNSGSLTVRYARDRAQIALAGYFAGKRDDSTYLSDAFFGYSMLLPNTDLSAAYQKFDISGSYRLHQRARAYLTLENVFDEQFAEAAGYPSLPRTVRVGIAVTLGGDPRVP